MKTSTLYYIYDPMCSWCYAFANTFSKLKLELNSNINVVYIAGGLAPFSKKGMPIKMQKKLQSIWRQITKYNGTTFNHDFWTKNKPRRSTYLSCLAVICAKLQNKELQMIEEIQYAYYLNAKNPSNEDTIINCAKNIELNINEFKENLSSKKVLNLFKDDLDKKIKLNINSFPSLIIEYDNNLYPIAIDYLNTNNMIIQINKIFID